QVQRLPGAVLPNQRRLITSLIDANPARGGEHVQDTTCGLQCVLARLHHMAEHRDLLALIFGDMYEHLRIAQISALYETRLQYGFDWRSRAASYFDSADQRIGDEAGVADSDLESSGEPNTVTRSRSPGPTR